jgi:hypothetical protein
MEIDDPRIKIIEDLIRKGQEVAKTEKYYSTIGVSEVNQSLFTSWTAQVEQFFMDNIDEKNAFIVKFKENVTNPNLFCHDKDTILTGVRLLQDLMKYLIDNPNYSKTQKGDSIAQIELICNRFHQIVRQLRRRYDNRNTIDVEDEYDVQDLLHSLLIQYFDDIRPEEPTPSYAGGAGRMDFLLKDERIVVETKITRKGKGTEDKRVGNELLQDIDRYKAHPDCSTLICFVYDPDGRISNPVGLISDLEKKNASDLRVIVYIKP